jgi:Fungal specific transcription factor domain
LFANDQEFQYFKIFADATSTSLGEYLDTTVWSHIVLQASQQEHFIKHAIIALGALNKSHDVTGRALVAGSVHYQVALQHYGKSIQGIRKACQEERKSRRTILIACLLAICFEYYHGNIDLAVAHVQNGIRLST